MLENRSTKKKNKQNGKGKKKPYKNRFFKVVIQKCEKSKKKKDFWQKLPDTICVRKGEKTRIFVHTNYLFWPKIFLDQNSVNQEKP